MGVDRRTFLRLAAAGLSSAAVHVSGCAGDGPDVRGTRHWPTPEQPLTPTAAWYYVALTDAYEADRREHRLRVGGQTRRTLVLSVDDLKHQFEVLTVPHTLSCVGDTPNGSLFSASLFRGVRCRDVLNAAGVRGRATAALVYGLDGYMMARTLGDVMREDTLLVFEMGTHVDELEPLDIEHGFPLRILTPGFYGYVQPKWISSITLVDESDHVGVLRRSNGYASGEMQLTCGVSWPRSGRALAPAPHEVVGYAFGDGRPIGGVDVAVNGGPWQPAEIVWNTLDDDLPARVWALWSFQWTPSGEGAHDLSVRARYADGETQRGGRNFPYSGGSIATMTVFVGGET